MADLPELRDHFGQPAGQRPGCGFPVAHRVALFDLATGMLLRVAAGPMRAHDMAKTPDAEADVAPGDVVLGDRGFCSFAHLATLLARGVDAVFRLHQKQLVDFTPGRAHARKGGRPARCVGGAAIALGAVEWGARPGGRLVQAGPETELDERRGIRRVARRDHGEGIALSGEHSGIPSSRDHPGDDPARPAGLPEAGAGGAVPSALAGGAEFPAHEDLHENGYSAVPDGRRRDEGVDDVYAGLQPDRIGASRVGGSAIGGGGSDWFRRCDPLADGSATRAETWGRS